MVLRGLHGMVGGLSGHQPWAALLARHRLEVARSQGIGALKTEVPYLTRFDAVASEIQGLSQPPGRPESYETDLAHQFMTKSCSERGSIAGEGRKERLCPQGSDSPFPASSSRLASILTFRD